MTATSLNELAQLLHDRDAAVRREAAIALGRLGDAAAGRRSSTRPSTMPTPSPRWSIRQAIRRSDAWDKDELIEALLDERRLEPALRLTDEAWSITVVAALVRSVQPNRRLLRCAAGSWPTSRACFTSIPIGTERGSAPTRSPARSRGRRKTGMQQP